MTNVINFPAMTRKLDQWPNRLRELREAANDGRGMKQHELGALVGLTAPMISQLETGKRTLSQPLMQSLARALGVDPVDLLSREDNPYPVDDEARDLMRLWPHIDDEGRAALKSVAEKFAGFRAQPAILDYPSGDQSAEPAPRRAKGRDAA